MPDMGDRAERVEVEVRVRVLDGHGREMIQARATVHEPVDALGHAPRWWAELGISRAGECALTAIEAATR